jgi:hypothetical protein
MAAKTVEKPFRVSCRESTVETGSYTAALRRRFEIEGLGACKAEHTVEARTPSGEWQPAHLALAAAALAAKVGTRVETFDGPLTKNLGTWSVETVQAAAKAGPEGSEAWYAALGGHEEATLTSDGRGAIVEGWCHCGGVEQARYERWSARGREAHGFVCKTCRWLTQTG